METRWEWRGRRGGRTPSPSTATAPSLTSCVTPSTWDRAPPSRRKHADISHKELLFAGLSRGRLARPRQRRATNEGLRTPWKNPRRGSQTNALADEAALLKKCDSTAARRNASPGVARALDWRPEVPWIEWRRSRAGRRAVGVGERSTQRSLIYYQERSRKVSPSSAALSPLFFRHAESENDVSAQSGGRRKCARTLGPRATWRNHALLDEPVVRHTSESTLVAAFQPLRGRPRDVLVLERPRANRCRSELQLTAAAAERRTATCASSLSVEELVRWRRRGAPLHDRAIAKSSPRRKTNENCVTMCGGRLPPPTPATPASPSTADGSPPPKRHKATHKVTGSKANAMPQKGIMKKSHGNSVNRSNSKGSVSDDSEALKKKICKLRAKKVEKTSDTSTAESTFRGNRKSNQTPTRRSKRSTSCDSGAVVTPKTKQRVSSLRMKSKEKLQPSRNSATSTVSSKSTPLKTSRACLHSYPRKIPILQNTKALRKWKDKLKQTTKNIMKSMARNETPKNEKTSSSSQSMLSATRSYEDIFAESTNNIVRYNSSTDGGQEGYLGDSDGIVSSVVSYNLDANYATQDISKANSRKLSDSQRNTINRIESTSTLRLHKAKESSTVKKCESKIETKSVEFVMSQPRKIQSEILYHISPEETLAMNHLGTGDTTTAKECSIRDFVDTCVETSEGKINEGPLEESQINNAEDILDRDSDGSIVGSLLECSDDSIYDIFNQSSRPGGLTSTSSMSSEETQSEESFQLNENEQKIMKRLEKISEVSERGKSKEDGKQETEVENSQKDCSSALDDPCNMDCVIKDKDDVYIDASSKESSLVVSSDEKLCEDKGNESEHSKHTTTTTATKDLSNAVESQNQEIEASSPSSSESSLMLKTLNSGCNNSEAVSIKTVEESSRGTSTAPLESAKRRGTRHMNTCNKLKIEIKRPSSCCNTIKGGSKEVESQQSERNSMRPNIVCDIFLNDICDTVEIKENLKAKRRVAQNVKENQPVDTREKGSQATQGYPPRKKSVRHFLSSSNDFYKLIRMLNANESLAVYNKISCPHLGSRTPQQVHLSNRNPKNSHKCWEPHPRDLHRSEHIQNNKNKQFLPGSRRSSVASNSRRWKMCPLLSYPENYPHLQLPIARNHQMVLNKKISRPSMHYITSPVPKHIYKPQMLPSKMPYNRSKNSSGFPSDLNDKRETFKTHFGVGESYFTFRPFSPPFQSQSNNELRRNNSVCTQTDWAIPPPRPNGEVRIVPEREIPPFCTTFINRMCEKNPQHMKSSNTVAQRLPNVPPEERPRWSSYCDENYPSFESQKMINLENQQLNPYCCNFNKKTARDRKIPPEENVSSLHLAACRENPISLDAVHSTGSLQYHANNLRTKGKGQEYRTPPMFSSQSVAKHNERFFEERWNVDRPRQSPTERRNQSEILPGDREIPTYLSGATVTGSSLNSCSPEFSFNQPPGDDGSKIIQGTLNYPAKHEPESLRHVQESSKPGPSENATYTKQETVHELEKPRKKHRKYKLGTRHQYSYSLGSHLEPIFKVQAMRSNTIECMPGVHRVKEKDMSIKPKTLSKSQMSSTQCPQPHSSVQAPPTQSNEARWRFPIWHM